MSGRSDAGIAGSSFPVQRVVLFKHGVAYIERVGVVDGDAGMDLLFRHSEMNDVLKSVTVLDLDGGAISSISYAAATPAERLLDDIALRVPEGDALLGLLQQLSGARIRVVHRGDTVEGTVAGVQRMHESGPDGHGSVDKAYVSILVGGFALRTFDVFQLSALEFCDETLQKDLQQLLDVVYDSKKKDKKKLTIFGRGQGKRRLFASYIIESPVWKTSYRILLDETPKIQGWAVVDNTQDDDWNDVKLSLMSGLPVSFVHDLYTPRYKKRQEIKVKEEEAVAPPVVERGMRNNDDYMAYDMPMAAPPPPPGMAGGAPMPMMGP